MTEATTAVATLELQERARAWVVGAFGEKDMSARERALHLVEEAMELAKAEGVYRTDMEAALAHVFTRPPGQPPLAAGGVGVGLLAWGAARNLDVDQLRLKLLERVERLPAAVNRDRYLRKPRRP